MGLASALSTALTGLTAAETVIDVAGNNLANANTIGFKSSEAVFATQFLQTQSLGSGPTANTGGNNPRQIGLGTKVAEISPDFTQGTIEISTNPSDLAIQGDGFFIVQDASGEQLYTRNGIFKTNSQNELVTVTGNRVLGFGVNDEFVLQTTSLKPITIPLGATQVAQATQNVILQGGLIPTGDQATTAEVIESATMGDGLKPRPDGTAATTSAAALPDLTSTTAASANSGAGGLTPGDTYRYKFVFVDSQGNETLPAAETVPPSTSSAVTVGGGDDSITISNIPNHADYSLVNIYRTENGGSTFKLVTGTPITAGAGSFSDGVADGSLGANIVEDQLNGQYKYYVTFLKSGEPESRPSDVIGPINIVNNRVYIDNLPTTAPTGAGIPAYDQIRLYRNVAGAFGEFFAVDTIPLGTVDYTDGNTDASISGTGNTKLDLDGPKIDSNTLLVNVVRSDGAADNIGYNNVFQLGKISFNGSKGGVNIYTEDNIKEFTIGAATTVQELVDFMTDAMGIQPSTNDPTNPIPGSLNTIDSTGSLSGGGSINTASGKIRFVANNGVGNAISISQGGLQLFDTSNLSVGNVALGFGSVQTAIGESANTTFVVHDTLGIELNVRLTSVLESTDDGGTTYRWFAESSDNSPLTGNDISVGTGLIQFDGEGNLISSSNTTVSIERRNIPSTSPLEFSLNFDGVSGLSGTESTLSVTSEDGSAPGVLTSFIIGEDGLIRGVFSNGANRDLGAIRLARFSNPGGLDQRGENLFATGVNSGLPVEGAPGEQGIGTIIAGAVELSNTDIGQSLIDLILASTQYRSNTRIVNTAQQLLDELLNLRR